MENGSSYYPENKMDHFFEETKIPEHNYINNEIFPSRRRTYGKLETETEKKNIFKYNPPSNDQGMNNSSQVSF